MSDQVTGHLSVHKPGVQTDKDQEMKRIREVLRDEFRARLKSLAGRVQSRNYFEMLDIPVDTVDMDLWDSFLTQIRFLFKPILSDPKDPLYQILDQVLYHLTEAYRVLSNPSIRATYQRFYQNSSAEKNDSSKHEKDQKQHDDDVQQAIIEEQLFEMTKSSSSASISEIADVKPDLEANPNLFVRGQQLLAAQNYPEAAKTFNRLVDTNPGCSKYHAYLGWSIYQSSSERHPKVVTQAKQSLSQALSLDANDPHALLFLGNIYADEGQDIWAQEMYLRILRKNPEHQIAKLMQHQLELAQKTNHKINGPKPLTPRTARGILAKKNDPTDDISSGLQF